VLLSRLAPAILSFARSLRSFVSRPNQNFDADLAPDLDLDLDLDPTSDLL
jgi:hypothetical protein